MNDLGIGVALGSIIASFTGVVILGFRVLSAYLRRRLDQIEGRAPAPNLSLPPAPPRRRRRRSIAERVFIPARDKRDTDPDEN